MKLKDRGLALGRRPHLLQAVLTTLPLLAQVASFLCVAILASGQTPLKKASVASGSFARSNSLALSRVLDSYFCGEWAALQKIGKNLVQSVLQEDTVRQTLQEKYPSVLTEASYFSVVLVTVHKGEQSSCTPSDRVPQLIRFLVRTHSMQIDTEHNVHIAFGNLEEFTTTLPGLQENFFELYLEEGLSGKHSSYYESQRVPSPFLTNVSPFLEAVLETGGAGLLAPGPTLIGRRIEFVLSSIGIAHDRAKVKIQDSVVVSARSNAAEGASGAQSRGLDTDPSQGQTAAGSGARTYTGQFTYTNTPPTKWNLGFVTAGLLSPGRDPRVKNEEEVLSADPLRGLTTIAAVNWIPFPSVPGTEKDSEWDRLRLFAGGVLTPEVGLSVGIGVRLVKNVSLVYGFAPFLRVDTLREGDMVGAPPADPESPLDRGYANAHFWGFLFEAWH